VTTPITHLVFDLGGVIVKLRGTPVSEAWFDPPISEEAIWKRWLTSDAPRAFESGQMDASAFAQAVVNEFELSVSADEYLDYFKTLPESVFDGAIECLQSLRRNYTTACFSNSNVLHWDGKLNDMGLRDCFDHHFASHLMGVVKPDRKGFEYLIEQLGVEPSQIGFFDDNQLNIDAAVQLGIQAHRVVGFDELKVSLSGLAIRFD